MVKKRYRIWIERRTEHCIEVSGDDLTPAQARDIVYESQERGSQCSKHSPTEKRTASHSWKSVIPNYLKTNNGKCCKTNKGFTKES